MLTDEYKLGDLYPRYANNGWRWEQIDVNDIMSFLEAFDDVLHACEFLRQKSALRRTLGL